jgi:hypothetical protein
MRRAATKDKDPQELKGTKNPKSSNKKRRSENNASEGGVNSPTKSRTTERDISDDQTSDSDSSEKPVPLNELHVSSSDESNND